MSSSKKQKLYCYIDETGQDVGSDFFITVAIVSEKDQHAFRNDLSVIEQKTKIFKRKWYRAGYHQRLDFMTRILENEGKFCCCFYIVRKKPVNFFLSWLEIVEKALFFVAAENYSAQVCVDGIDNKKAQQLTSALRSKGIKLSFVKTAQDERDSCIRLADRVVGLIRTAKEQGGEYLKLLSKAENLEFIKQIKTTP